MDLSHRPRYRSTQVAEIVHGRARVQFHHHRQKMRAITFSPSRLNIDLHQRAGNCSTSSKSLGPAYSSFATSRCAPLPRALSTVWRSCASRDHPTSPGDRVVAVLHVIRTAPTHRQQPLFGRDLPAQLRQYPRVLHAVVRHLNGPNLQGLGINS